MIKIRTLMSKERELALTKLLIEYADVFAWKLGDMPGIYPKIIQHELRIKPGTTPFRQKVCKIAPEYHQPIENELSKLLKAGFIKETPECEIAFQQIKEYLATIPILQKPDPDEVLALYIAATDDAVSAVLVKTNTKIEQPIYYVNKTLNPEERNYTKIEQLILALVWATQKLRTYFLTHYVRVPCKAPLEVILKSTGKVGRIEKWNTHLDQFNIIHEIQHSQKSQVLADFLADLPLDNDEEVQGMPETEDGKDPVDILEPTNQRQWEVFVDGSRNREGAGIGIVIATPTGERIVHALRLEFKGHTNNIVEYEDVVHALRLIIEMGLTKLRYISSMLKDESVKAIKISSVYEPSIIPQQSLATHRKDNVGEDIAEDDVREDIYDDFMEDDIVTKAYEDEDFTKEKDWRSEIHLNLQEGTLPADLKLSRKIQAKAGRYDLRDGILYKKSFLGPLLRCVSRQEGHLILKEIHYGDAGNHSGMRSLSDKAKMQGYYWTHMIRDAARMARRCEECQQFSRRIHAPATKLNSVDSP
ncbi:uncharacterized protein LOC113294895 [Papaver somniferum]|uniref:uncharacterized protein LOC113294895 n=1 Tax=Papaver somniferum TaxID=3469 RepID=UPI000E6FB194|nr:uncharacterized protein LOC113294895 [Papaver somniferum]